MGFCLFNNVAVAAAAALARGLERVMIVDFDVHHGNGTQAIFYADPRVLYVSSHAFPFYPGTGGLEETGHGPGAGFTVNLPLPQGAGDAEYVRIYQELVEPLGRSFDPQLLLVSAGFDAVAGDPLAGMQVSARGFGAIAASCLRAAAGASQGRAVFALEGGYHLEGIATSAAAVVHELLNDATSDEAWLEPAPGLDRMLSAYRQVHAERWPVLRA
jgi:acetoin utilization deacetylase AcuC-like enzyme